jgi:hypothetical protein
VPDSWALTSIFFPAYRLFPLSQCVGLHPVRFPPPRYRIIFIGGRILKGSPLDPSHSALPLSSSQCIERERGTDAVAGRNRSGHRTGHLSFGSTPRTDFDDLHLARVAQTWPDSPE